MTSHLTIRRASDPKALAEFVKLPYRLYRTDPNWRAPLRFERKEQLDPKKNPGLAKIEAAYWLAERDGHVVGRCASFLNHSHLDLYQDETGHFGFLDAEPGDRDVIAALMKQSEDWLREKGMTAIAGPFNFSVNEECGMLVEGFDTPPMMLMPHGRADYPKALEALGYEKAKDLLVFLSNVYEGFPRPPIVPRMQAYVDKSEALRLRPMRKSAFEEEISLAMDIFNDAWANNWSFVPFSEQQVQHMAAQLKQLIDPDGFWFGEKDGRAVGFVLMAPNLNEAAAGLDGRLFPFGWAQFLYRLKVRGVKTARIPLMGIRQEIQKTRAGSALMLSLFEQCYDAMRPKGIEDVELGWVLENNVDVQNMIALSGAKVYKIYRIYQKPLAAV